MRKRRPPGWLKITLGVFGILFILAAILGRPSTPAGVAEATRPAPAALPTYTVVSVNGTTVELIDAKGNHTSVRASGITMPTAADCYGAETTNWASAFLTDKHVIMKTLDNLAMITLEDGTMYSAMALRSGHAKYAGDALSAGYSATLQDAESSARTAGTGVWGAPCMGSFDTPAPPPATTTTAGTPAPPPPAAPPATTRKAPTPESTQRAIVYESCSQARAAHAAPLHAGQPGYSRKLDRDGDGVACEKEG